MRLGIERMILVAYGCLRTEPGKGLLERAIPCRFTTLVFQGLLGTVFVFVFVFKISHHIWYLEAWFVNTFPEVSPLKFVTFLSESGGPSICQAAILNLAFVYILHMQ